MTRRAHKVDRNQKQIVSALRACGVRVEILSDVGRGVPDLLCATRHGPMVMLEVKDGNKPPSQQKLTVPEQEWHALWHEHVFTVRNVDEALKAVGVI